jgi:heme/copper-type cytochrome/quinol oxidase subunit 3
MLVPLTFSLHDSSLFPISVTEGTLTGLTLFLVTIFAWFTAIVRESALGDHTKTVQKGLRLGMLLFILSEVMLFFAFFWAFFHFSLVPAISVGNMWPPEDTQILSTWDLPLLNTMLLLQSGLTITIAHTGLVKTNPSLFITGLLLTVFFGVAFLFCQGDEYSNGVSFSFHDDVFGSIFFITTGFHGMHVTIGTLFLLICAIRHLLTTANLGGTFNPNRKKFRKLNSYALQPWQHFGFEAAAWYWHFVDVVWLFLFIAIYWWGAA